MIENKNNSRDTATGRHATSTSFNIGLVWIKSLICEAETMKIRFYETNFNFQVERSRERGLEPTEPDKPLQARDWRPVSLTSAGRETVNQRINQNKLLINLWGL